MTSFLRGAVNRVFGIGSRVYGEARKYVESWPFGLLLKVLCYDFTYFCGSGRA